MSDTTADQRLTTSAGATLRWDRAGGLVCEARLGTAPLPIPGDLVPLLDQFSDPITADDAISRFLSRFVPDADPASVIEPLRARVQSWHQAGVLIDTNAQPGARRSGYYSDVAVHVAMLRDFTRTAAYREALRTHAPGQTVVEIGCGSGILSCYAARFGATRVFAIEETDIIDVAREIAERNGVADRIVFLPGNSLDIELDERADVIVSELISIDPLAEYMLTVLPDAVQRFGKPGATLIPHALEVCVCGAESEQLRRRARQDAADKATALALGRYLDLDLAPLADRYAKLVDLARDASSEPQHLGGPQHLTRQTEQHRELPAVATTETTLAHIDLTSTAAADLLGNQTISVTATRAGAINAVLTYFHAELADGIVLSSAPTSPQTLHWGQMQQPVTERTVDLGEALHINVDTNPYRRPTSRFRWASASIAADRSAGDGARANRERGQSNGVSRVSTSA